jgi:His-Xaa-Ser system radical SAM maturase HxsC
MCSQPPTAADDRWLVDAWLQAIPLMSAETSELGITGGEPTLLGDAFLNLIAACNKHLPQTGVHVLSNGRLFNYLSFPQALSAIGHHDLVIGIPLYSDIAWQHDFIVQAPGAFDQTVRGLLNLARCGVRIEIRVVIHSLSIPRLAGIAAFIARNLPFVEHVALMGLEPIGFARSNLASLWADPIDYQAELDAAIAELAAHDLNVSIYNHQLCVLPPSLWSFARQSISDWKNVYLPTCEQCAVRDQCGGFFHSAVNSHSRAISPISHQPV